MGLGIARQNQRRRGGERGKVWKRCDDLGTGDLRLGEGRDERRKGGEETMD